MSKRTLIPSNLTIPDPRRMPRFMFRIAKLPPRIVYALGLGPIMGGLVLLLVTTGNRTGLKRVTPLQYEEIDGRYYVAAVRGTAAHWYRNLLADPHVEVRVKNRHFRARAEILTDITHIADFFEVGLKRHPLMVGMMLRATGSLTTFTRTEIEQFAAQAVVVALQPENPGNG